MITETGPITEEREILQEADVPIPEPGPGMVRIRVSACGVCHTELDEIEGRTPPPELPVIPGHEVVGRVDLPGEGVRRFKIGDRVGVGWIYSSCGRCSYCLSGKQNLCPEFKATGRDANGGYAEYMVVPEGSAYPIPEAFSDTEAAPLLCAGSTGYRSLRLTGLLDGALPDRAPKTSSSHSGTPGAEASEGKILGFTGFGASAHLVMQLALHLLPGLRCFVFARSERQREFAEELGASWTGATEDSPPEAMDAIIDTTPAWKPVAYALRHLKPGGRLVINAIRKEEKDKAALLKLDYGRDLWMEREIKSVANLTPYDIETFLKHAAEIPIKPLVETYNLCDAGKALKDLKKGNARGAKVLVVP